MVSRNTISEEVAVRTIVLKGDYTYLTDKQAIEIIKNQEFGEFVCKDIARRKPPFILRVFGKRRVCRMDNLFIHSYKLFGKEHTWLIRKCDTEKRSETNNEI